MPVPYVLPMVVYNSGYDPILCSLPSHNKYPTGTIVPANGNTEPVGTVPAVENNTDLLIFLKLGVSVAL